MRLPAAGSVLGVDVGWSLKARSSAACRLDWDDTTIGWTIRRFTAQPDERRDGVHAVIGSHSLLSAAFDGPLRGDLAIIDRYRHAERMLSVRPLRDAIGKLAQSNSGNGRLLNAATNDCARNVIDVARLNRAVHAQAIHRLAIVEAFPNSFLGLMLADPAPHKGGRGSRSDRYYTALADAGVLDRLLLHCLPGRRINQRLAAVTNHDDRAALVCAMTALCLAADDYTAVGDDDGWIILPPAAFIAAWARPWVASWNQGRHAGLSR